ncbi:MAG: PAS domain S-box protein [Thermoleophilia bacterium]|nr:PAS domain S-box protein [Thermoleophilia bacterium]
MTPDGQVILLGPDARVSAVHGEGPLAPDPGSAAGQPLEAVLGTAGADPAAGAAAAEAARAAAGGRAADLALVLPEAGRVVGLRIVPDPPGGGAVLIVHGGEGEESVLVGGAGRVGWSSSAARVRGWHPGGLLTDRVHPADHAALDAARAGPAVARVRTHSGGWEWMQCRTRPAAGGGRLVTWTPAPGGAAAERALHSAEERFRHVVTAMREGAVLRYADGRIGMANPALCRMFGRTEAEVLAGAPWAREGVVRADRTPMPPEEFPTHRTLATGQPLDDVLIGFVRADGELRWAEVSTRPLFDLGADRPSGVVGTLVDVTDRLAAEQALRAAHDAYRSLLDNVPDAVVRIDRRGRCVAANAASAALLGTPVDRLVGAEPHEVAVGTPGERQQWRLVVQAVLADGRPRGSHARAEVHGRTRDLDVRVLPERDPDGTVTSALVVMRDETGRLEAERAREASEVRYRALVEDLGEMVFRFRFAPERRYEYVSPSSVALIGRTPEDHYADPELFMRIIHPDDLPAILAAQSDPGALAHPRRLRLIHADGDVRWVEMRSRLVEDDEGGLVLHGVVRDVTEQMIGQERQALAARERGELVALVSHELRAPLASLETLLSFALQDQGRADAPDVTAYVGMALRRVSRLRRLAADLTVMTQLDADRLRLRLADVDLGELVDDLVGPVAREAAGGDVARVEADTRPVLAYADRDRIGQVVDNLVANALKFGPRQGRVRVEVDGDAQHARLTVTDEGPGVPPAERERVFERFHRVAGAAGNVPGSGLGLAIARAIVEAHGGRIWLEDGPGGQGLAARVELPREGPAVTPP